MELRFQSVTLWPAWGDESPNLPLAYAHVETKAKRSMPLCFKRHQHEYDAGLIHYKFALHATGNFIMLFGDRHCAVFANDHNTTTKHVH